MKYFIFLFTICIFFTSCDNQDKSITKYNVTSISDSIHFMFNKDSSWNYLLKQTSFGARNPNSIGHQRCLIYLNNELKRFTNSVQIFQFQKVGYNENLYLTNIFASFRPELKNRILLVAHWDTRPRSDNDKDISKQKLPLIGANDGASGVAVLLEIARILKTKPPAIGVDILFVDGEDYGNRQDLEYFSLGAKQFAKSKPISYHPQFAILLDMIGDKELEIFKEINSMKFAPGLCNTIWQRAEILNLTQFKSEIKHEVYDDHIILNEYGIPTIDIIDFDYSYWHTSDDTPNKCSSESLQTIGKLLLNIIFDPPSHI